MEITQELLHELFEYKDGELYWKVSLSNSVKVGDKIGNKKSSKGYKTVRINKKPYYAHRIIFMMFYGYFPEYLDHINRNREDNRIENLRQATRNENNRNAGIRKDNTSGYKGVSWSKAANKWVAYVQYNKKIKHLGCFDDLKIAALVAEEARLKYHGDFANHR